MSTNYLAITQTPVLVVKGLVPPAVTALSATVSPPAWGPEYNPTEGARECSRVSTPALTPVSERPITQAFAGTPAATHHVRRPRSVFGRVVRVWRQMTHRRH